MAKRISEIGRRPWQRILRCPNCGGASFAPRRSNAGRVVSLATLGIGALVTPKSRVSCQTCRTAYKRR
jgi:hypothetical protein